MTLETPMWSFLADQSPSSAIAKLPENSSWFCPSTYPPHPTENGAPSKPGSMIMCNNHCWFCRKPWYDVWIKGFNEVIRASLLIQKFERTPMSLSNIGVLYSGSIPSVLVILICHAWALVQAPMVQLLLNPTDDQRKLTNNSPTIQILYLSKEEWCTAHLSSGSTEAREKTHRRDQPAAKHPNDGYLRDL